MAEWLLPLFPLDVVLFPGTDLPLHIFEERYKQMIGECLANATEFGIVMVDQDGEGAAEAGQSPSVETIGCTAGVAEVVKTYPDGRMDIVARGSRRFEILMFDSELPYLRGEPSFFDDEDRGLPLNDPRRRTAMDLFARMQEVLHLRPPPRDEEGLQVSDEFLSFRIAARIPGNWRFKQALLEIRSEEERLTQLNEYLDKLVIKISAITKARARASSNGRLHH